MSFLSDLLNPGKKIANSVNAANQANLDEGLNALLESLFRQETYTNTARGKIGERTDEIRGLLDGTLADIDSIGRSGRLNILDRETEGMADVRAGLNASGLGNTSVVANAQRGVRSDTDRSLLQLDDQLARTRAGARQGNAGMLASLLGDEVGIETFAAQLDANNAGQVAGLYGSNRQQVPASAFQPSPLLGALGSLGGFILGGGLGGGGGGAPAWTNV